MGIKFQLCKMNQFWRSAYRQHLESLYQQFFLAISAKDNARDIVGIE